MDWAEQVGMSFRRAAGQYSDSQRPGAIPEDSDESGNEDVDEEIASAFSKPRNSEPEVSAQFVSEIQRTFDDLVSSYAEKALEFPSSYVPPLVDGKLPPSMWTVDIDLALFPCSFGLERISVTRVVIATLHNGWCSWRFSN